MPSYTFPRALPSLVRALGKPRLIRFQSRNLTGGGSVDAIEVADPLWQCRYSVSLNDRADEGMWSAWIDSLRDGLRAFRGPVPRHRWPLRYPTGLPGAWDGLAAVKAIGAGRDSLTIDGLPNGLVMSPGDFISVAVGTKQHLHRVTEGSISASGEVTLSIEPRLSAAAVVDAVVRFEDPWCDMHIAEWNESGGGHQTYNLSFTGMQVLL